MKLVEALKEKHQSKIQSLEDQVASKQDDLVIAHAEAQEQKNAVDKLNEEWQSKFDSMQREMELQIEELKY